jgi:hypothetical protein
MLPSEQGPPVLPPPIPKKPKMHWGWFLLALFLPTVLTVLAAQAKSQDVAPPLAVIGGGISGLVGGSLLAIRVGKTPEARIGLGIAFAIVLSVACVTMNCVGCLAGGYKFNVR